MTVNCILYYVSIISIDSNHWYFDIIWCDLLKFQVNHITLFSFADKAVWFHYGRCICTWNITERWKCISEVQFQTQTGLQRLRTHFSLRCLWTLSKFQFFKVIPQNITSKSFAYKKNIPNVWNWTTEIHFYSTLFLFLICNKLSLSIMLSWGMSEQFSNISIMVLFLFLFFYLSLSKSSCCF